MTLEAYCWPPSVGRGEPVELFVSTDAPTFDVAVVREGAGSEPVWSAEGIAGRSHDTPEDASSNGCGWPPALEIPVGALAVGIPRRHRDRRRRTRRRVPRRSTRPVRPGADPPRALDDDLARVQRLGRSVAVHRRHARLVRTPAREGLPRQARADRPDDAARTRPGGDGVPPLGAPARPLGVVRRGRMVHLRTDLHPLGRGQRLPRRRRDLAGPRGAPGDPRGPAARPRRRPRRVLVVGHARRVRCVRRARRQRGDPVGEHVVLAGEVRPRAPRDDRLQVPSGRRPGPRARRTNGS